jgi:hypothetical protein
MVGEKGVDFHEPICIEGDTLSNFACRQILLFWEVLFVVKSDDDIPVFFISGKVLLKLWTIFNLMKGVLRMFLCVPKLDLIFLVFVDFVHRKPLCCLAGLYVL